MSWSRTPIFLLTVTLAVVALFFTLRIAKFKGDLGKSARQLQIVSGQKVTVTKVVDGDELAAEMGERRFRVRLLGIKSFDPSVNDKALSQVGREAMQRLSEWVEKKEVELVFDTLQIDDRERLLAYVHREGEDIGREMVFHGLALPYLLYPVGREAKYRAVQQTAQSNRAGCWGTAESRNRCLKLLQVWEAEAQTRNRKAGGTP